MRYIRTPLKTKDVRFPDTTHEIVVLIPRDLQPRDAEAWDEYFRDAFTYGMQHSELDDHVRIELDRPTLQVVRS